MIVQHHMYKERVKGGNIPVMRYCGFGCSYCAFQKFTKISPCPDCRGGVNHTHLEVLNRVPPKTAPGQFLTIGLSGDVSFMSYNAFRQVIEYCKHWKDRTFLIQSKNPFYFLQFDDIPTNVILGTTIESNVLAWASKDGLESYEHISKAPVPQKRYEAMKLVYRKSVTIEPILNFEPNFFEWIVDIKPEFIYIGYDSKPSKNKLPEPTLEKTLALIQELEESGIEVRRKLIRGAWNEKP